MMTYDEYSIMQKDSWTTTSMYLSKKMKRIINDKVVNHIRIRPYDSEYLHFELEGLRSYNKLKTGYRIIFAICEECRKNNVEEANNCIDCDEIPNNTIMLFAVGDHDIYDDIKRKRQRLISKVRKKKSRRN